MIAATRPVKASAQLRPRVARRGVVVRADPVELKNKIAESIKEAEDTCKSGPSGECAAAWDEVEELSAAASHLKDQGPTDPLEKYCESAPDADECRVYED